MSAWPAVAVAISCSNGSVTTQMNVGRYPFLWSLHAPSHPIPSPSLQVCWYVLLCFADSGIPWTRTFISAESYGTCSSKRLVYLGSSGDYFPGVYIIFYCILGRDHFSSSLIATFFCRIPLERLAFQRLKDTEVSVHLDCPGAACHVWHWEDGNWWRICSHGVYTGWHTGGYIWSVKE